MDLVSHPRTTLATELLKKKSQHEVQEIIQERFVEGDAEVKCLSLPANCS